MTAARAILSASLFTVLFLLCLVFVGLRVLGFGTFIVTGGSMEPTIHKGSLIVVEPVLPDQVRVGDVITFQKYGQTTSHRVVTAEQAPAGRVFTTKGDANAAADPEPTVFPGRVGIVRTAIPAVGYAIASVQAYWRLVLGLIAALSFFACAGAVLFGRESPDARVLPAARRRIPARVAIAVGDVDAAWTAHLDWVERSRARALRAA